MTCYKIDYYLQISSRTIQLSDGWYTMYAQVDSNIEMLIKQRKIRIGTKLLCFGAQLVSMLVNNNNDKTTTMNGGGDRNENEIHPTHPLDVSFCFV
jgi:hypothetical protein